MGDYDNAMDRTLDDLDERAFQAFTSRTLSRMDKSLYIISVGILACALSLSGIAWKMGGR